MGGVAGCWQGLPRSAASWRKAVASLSLWPNWTVGPPRGFDLGGKLVQRVYP